MLLPSNTSDIALREPTLGQAACERTSVCSKLCTFRPLGLAQFVGQNGDEPCAAAAG
jgi:hypothetical protein